MTLLNWLLENKKPDEKDLVPCSRHLKKLVSQWEQLAVIENSILRIFENDDGTIITKQKLIPVNLRNQVLKHCHEHMGHFGEDKTGKHLAKSFYWPGWTADVRDHIKTCRVCQERKAIARKPRARLQHLVVGNPLERVSMDLLGRFPLTKRNNRHILVITDYFTKYLHAIALPNEKAETVASAFMDHFVSYHGLPQTILTDQGPAFESAVFKELCSKMGIEETRSSAPHPEGNGQVERWNRTALDMLSKVATASKHDWDIYLPYVSMYYRNAVHRTTGYTPNEALMGRNINLPLDWTIKIPSQLEGQTEDHSLPDYVKNTREKIQKCHDIVRKKLGTAFYNAAHYYNRKKHHHTYKVGDTVLLYASTRKIGISPKISRFWTGVYVVTKVLSDVIYRIQQGPRTKPRVVHHNRLKTYHSKEHIDTTWVGNLEIPQIPARVVESDQEVVGENESSDENSDSDHDSNEESDDDIRYQLA